MSPAQRPIPFCGNPSQTSGLSDDELSGAAATPRLARFIEQVVRCMGGENVVFAFEIMSARGFTFIVKRVADACCRYEV
jgi:hypothetical protein